MASRRFHKPKVGGFESLPCNHLRGRMTKREWVEVAKKNGISGNAFSHRVNKHNWPYEKAATTPIRKRIQHRQWSHYLYPTFRGIQVRVKNSSYQHIKNNMVCSQWDISGVTCCEEWNKKFTSFVNHYEFLAGELSLTGLEAYTKGLMIDRKDNYQGYCPYNVFRLATTFQQANNRRKHIATMGQKLEILRLYKKGDYTQAEVVLKVIPNIREISTNKDLSSIYRAFKQEFMGV